MPPRSSITLKSSPSETSISRKKIVSTSSEQTPISTSTKVIQAEYHEDDWLNVAVPDLEWSDEDEALKSWKSRHNVT